MRSCIHYRYASPTDVATSLELTDKANCTEPELEDLSSSHNINPVRSYLLLQKHTSWNAESSKTSTINNNDMPSAPADTDVTVDDSAPGGEHPREDTRPVHSFLTRTKKWQNAYALNKCVHIHCTKLRGLSFVLCSYVKCAGRFWMMLNYFDCIMSGSCHTLKMVGLLIIISWCV